LPLPAVGLNSETSGLTFPSLIKFPSLPETVKSFDCPESTLFPEDHKKIGQDLIQDSSRQHKINFQPIMEGNNQSLWCGGVPFPSICLAVPSCLSNANLSPFLDWLISSLPERKYERKKSKKNERGKKQNRRGQSNHTRMHAYIHKMQIQLWHIRNYLTG